RHRAVPRILAGKDQPAAASHGAPNSDASPLPGVLIPLGQKGACHIRARTKTSVRRVSAAKSARLAHKTFTIAPSASGGGVGDRATTTSRRKLYKQSSAHAEAREFRVDTRIDLIGAIHIGAALVIAALFRGKTATVERGGVGRRKRNGVVVD